MYQQVENTRPFIRWVGGKVRSLKQLLPFFPAKLPRHFVEPFVGSGAVYFAIAPLFETSLINDLNEDLITAYRIIQKEPQNLIKGLKSCIYNRDFFYKVRNFDRVPGLEYLSRLQRAVRLIYLVEAGFNGLYRVSDKGLFNVPFGSHVRPTLCRSLRIAKCSSLMSLNPTTILSTDFMDLLDRIDQDSFVYIDPPYEPLSPTSFFTSYQSNDWGPEDSWRLAEFCNKLHQKGVLFMQSNSTADINFKLYRNYNINTLSARRSINAKGDRSSLKELVITNYDNFKGEVFVNLSKNVPTSAEEVSEVREYTLDEVTHALKEAFGDKLAQFATAETRKKVLAELKIEALKHFA